MAKMRIAGSTAGSAGNPRLPGHLIISDHQRGSEDAVHSAGIPGGAWRLGLVSRNICINNQNSGRNAMFRQITQNRTFMFFSVADNPGNLLDYPRGRRRPPA